MLFLVVKAAKLKTGKIGTFDEHKINRDSDGKFSSKPGSKKVSPKKKTESTNGPSLDDYLAATPSAQEAMLGKSKASLLKGQEKWRTELSREEKTAISDYTSELYEDINESLRKGAVPSGLKSTIQTLDRAIAKSTIPHDVTLFRGVQSRRLLDKAVANGSPSFTDLGFSSTSISHNTAAGFTPEDRPVMLAIRVKKGQKGAFLGKNLSAEPAENEVLLPRNARFTITGKSVKKINASGGRSSASNSGGAFDVEVFEVEYDDAAAP